MEIKGRIKTIKITPLFGTAKSPRRAKETCCHSDWCEKIIRNKITNITLMIYEQTNNNNNNNDNNNNKWKLKEESRPSRYHHCLARPKVLEEPRRLAVTQTGVKKS